jgi:hypothetical protein
MKQSRDSVGRKQGNTSWIIIFSISMEGDEGGGRRGCFSSVNRASHYNRQKALFERNIGQLRRSSQVRVCAHVQTVAEMFSLLTEAQGQRTACLDI